MNTKLPAGLVALSLLVSCNGAAMTPEQCRVTLSDYLQDSQHPSKAAHVLQLVEKFEGQCDGSGYLELLRANALLASGDLDDAQAASEKGRRVAQFDTTPFYEIEFAINSQRNEPEKNLALAEQLVQANPGLPQGYYLLGKHYLLAGDLAKAAAALEKSKRLGSADDVYAADKLLIPLYWEQDRVSDVAAAFESAERARPDLAYNDWTVTRLAAVANLLVGDFERAKSIVERQLQLHPETASDRHIKELGMQLAAKGFPIKALKQ